MNPSANRLVAYACLALSMSLVGSYVALSKPLVRPETAGSRLVDYRISTYQPMAYVEVHTHKVQEQIYHVLEGEGSMEIEGKKQIVRKHDVIFIPPGLSHSIVNNGITDLTFIVVTTPVEDK